MNDVKEIKLYIIEEIKSLPSGTVLKLLSSSISVVIVWQNGNNGFTVINIFT
jgi:hypothetical protein